MPTVIFYNFILLSSTFFVWLSEKGRTKIDRNVLIFIAFMIVFIPSAIRYGVGANYFSYLHIYEKSWRLDIYKFIEPGFYYVNYFLKSLDAHFQWSFAAFSFLFSYAVFKSYPRKQSWLIHLTFFAIFYLLSFFYVRTAVAVGFSMWALYTFIQGRTYLFLILIAIASLFHLSALIVGVIGLLSLVPMHRYVKLYIFPIISVLVLVVAFFKNSLLFTLIEYVLKMAGLTRYTSYFSSTKWMDTRNLGTGLGVLTKVLFSLFFILNVKHIIKINKRFWAVLIFVFMYALGIVLSAQVVIFSRLAYMFIFAVPFAVFILLKLPKNKKINRFVILIFILISIAGLTKDGFDKGGNWGESLLLNPYQTIFSEL